MRVTDDGDGASFGVMDVLEWLVVKVPQSVKVLNATELHIDRVNFMLHKLWLNKAVEKNKIKFSHRMDGRKIKGSVG